MNPKDFYLEWYNKFALEYYKLLLILSVGSIGFWISQILNGENKSQKLIFLAIIFFALTASITIIQ